jgi:hypothetical protein
MNKKKDVQKSLLSDSEDTNNVKENITAILLYALSLATALGFNDLILSMFDTFKWKTHILAKTVYVFIMFGITIGLAYYMNSNINKR